MIEDEMVGCHHRLSGHEFKQTPGDSEGQGSLVCCSPWGLEESDMTQQLTELGQVTSVFCILISKTRFIIILPFTTF